MYANQNPPLSGPVGWGYRKHRQHLCSNTHPTSALDITLYNLTVRPYSGALRNAEYPFIVIAPRITLPGVIAPDRVLSMGEIELNSVLLLSWIVWNRTVLTFKLRNYAKLNCSKGELFWVLSAGAVEYIHSISADEKAFPNEFPGYDTTIWWWGFSNAGDLGNAEFPHYCHTSQVHSVPEWWH